jgi:long-chain acyl-CoA synthetase
MERLWLKSYAEGVPHTIDLQQIGIPEALSNTAKRFPDNKALIYFGKSITYRELDSLTSRFSAGLKNLGVEPGDRVGLLLPNLVQTVAAICGILRIGAIAVPNNPLYTDRELEHQLKDADVSVLICLDTLVPRMIKLRPKTAIKKIITCHINEYMPFPLKQLFPFLKKDLYLKTRSGDGIYEFKDLLNYGEAQANHLSAMSDTAIIIYTGGTTGVSKGVELTHGNLSANCQQMRAWCPGFEDGREVILGCLPFFHSYGLTAAMNMSIFYGWTNVLIPKPEIEPILSAIHKYKVSLIPAVPTLYNAIINHPKTPRFSLKSVKGCFSAAAPLPLETIRGFKALTGITISEAYGLTESSPCSHAIPLGGIIKPGCIGLPMPGTDAKIVDADDYSVEVTEIGKPGELCVKGPQVMKGYVNRPDETANVLRDGWLLTGDVAVVDEEGYFTIVDRKKDMIISGGFNIYPREIDEVLYEFPKIKEACAIGIPDGHSGERVKAFVVLKDGVDATEQEIIEYCKERLTRYKVPKFIEFVAELPKSAVGKILRKDLKRVDARDA